MAFRTVVVDTHSKLEYSLNYLVFRTPETTKRILLDEIHTLIIQSTEVALTSSLISELTKRKIKVLFCDAKKNPESELIPLYGAHNSFAKLKQQLSWSESAMQSVWKSIIEMKIFNQGKRLLKIGQNERSKMLFDFSKEVTDGDQTNREGHAAKVYFNCAFFEGFNRDLDCPTNAALNYGYTIILTAFNRSVVACGYLTQLGIHHIGELNPFNLSCDLMEPFRVYVDDVAASIQKGSDFKKPMVELLAKEVRIDGKNQTMANAITIYCQSVFSALSQKDPLQIKFPEYD